MKTAKRPKLTRQQERVLRFIASHFARRLQMPTMREICKHMGYSDSPNAAHCHVLALKKKGYILKPAGKASYRLLEVAGLSEVITDAVKDHVRGLIATGG